MGFVSCPLDLWQHHLHAAGKITIYHQHVILEHNPALIAVAFIEVALMEINIGRYLLDHAYFIIR